MLLALAAVAAEVQVRSGAEFLAALRDATQYGCTGEATVELASSVAVSQATVDALGIALPLQVPSGCTLSLLGGQAGQRAGCPIWSRRGGGGRPASGGTCGFSALLTLRQRFVTVLTPLPAASGNGLTTIDFGMLDNTIMTQPLLFLEANSTLVLESLNVVGAASPAVGAVTLPVTLEASVQHAEPKCTPGSSKACK